MEELFVWARVELLDAIVDKILEKDFEENPWRAYEESCFECSSSPRDISDAELEYIERRLNEILNNG